MSHIYQQHGLLRLALLAIVLLLANGCSTIPPAPEQAEVRALPPAKEGDLARLADDFASRHQQGDSGFLLLDRNHDALLWRLALVDHATTSIDVQYFIWDSDEAARLLFYRIALASERGVRVRILVDDLLLAARDKYLAAISQHSNIEIKLFNPGRIRESTLGSLSEFIFYFKEMNRRMHNKLFVVDNRIAIVGGRNIGNAYFGLSEKYNFVDLDVLTIGPVVQEISTAFDEYWNAELAYPASALRDSTEPGFLDELDNEFREKLNSGRAKLSAYPTEPTNWQTKLAQLPALMVSGEAHFIQDEAVLSGEEELRLADMLDILATPSHKELTIVTPYLIPVDGFLEDLNQLSEEGVRVRIITNSLGSNNHTAAHSHYKKYRRAILDTGAELYEFRHDPTNEVRGFADVAPVEADFISLHIKSLVGDRARCFVGSLNLDPRAVVINTENGLYIESEDLCGRLASDFDILLSADNAWQVSLDKEGNLQWISVDETVTSQPARGFGQRISDFFFRLLPIESQL